MSRKSKPKRQSHARKAVRRHMRRFADVTTNRIIMDAVELARKGQCEKAVRNLRLVRSMDYDPLYMGLATKNLDRYCGGTLTEAEETSRFIEQSVFAPSAELKATTPLTTEAVKMTAREAQKLNLTRQRIVEDEEAKKLRATFKVKSDEIDPATGLPKLKRVALSARNVKKMLREGRITHGDAKVIVEELKKLNQARNLTAGLNRPESLVDVNPEVLLPTTGRGRYKKGYAKTLLLRGSARTMAPQIQSTLRKRDPYEPQRERVRRVPQAGRSVTQILTEIETGKMMERQWDPVAQKWRTPKPHGKGVPASTVAVIEALPASQREALKRALATESKRMQLEPTPLLYRKPYKGKVRTFKPPILPPLEKGKPRRRGVRPMGWWW